MHDVDTARLFPKRVLVVEDDEDVRKAIADLLIEQAYVPLCASDGYDALAVLEERDITPGLIVLDLMLPGMNGPAFAAAIRQDARWREVPILVVSADPDIDAVSKDLGAAATLRKPFDVERFVDLVQASFSTLAESEATSAEPTVPSLIPRKALVIDDNEVSLRAIAAVLHDAGLEVAQSLGLVGVGAALSREKPDVVIVGSMIPAMVHKRLVALLRERGAPCVMLSGDVRDDASATAISDLAGADGYLSTRASRERVEGSLRAAVGQDAQRRAN